jgi:hypothetical protein
VLVVLAAVAVGQAIGAQQKTEQLTRVAPVVEQITAPTFQKAGEVE